MLPERQRPGAEAGQPGDYFVTVRLSPHQLICLSNVQGPDPDQIKFTPFGQLVVNAWFDLSRQCAAVRPGPILIMPDHIHALLTLERPKGILPPPPPPPSLIEQFKTASTNRVNRVRRTPGCPFWESGYRFRPLADAGEKAAAYQYMVSDPARWMER